MPSRASAALALCILVATGYAVAAAWSWPTKTALFPLVIGIPVFCLAVVELVWSLLGSAKQAGAIRDFRMAHGLPQAEILRRTGLAAAWIFGFFAAIVVLGFPLAVPMFVFLHLKLDGRESWLVSAVMAAAVWLLFYGLFDRLLHLPFPQGWLLALSQ